MNFNVAESSFENFCIFDPLPLEMPMSNEDELYWLALALTPGLGARRAGQLLRKFHSPQQIFRASAAELEAAGLPGSIASSIASGCAFEDAADQQELIRRRGARLVTRFDPAYPARLGDIYDPPVLLFVLGDVRLLSGDAIAIVGTRRPTPYGIAAAERIAGDLARAGLTITSGLARGIDTAAHRACLQANGSTIA